MVTNAAVYALAALYSMRLFHESIEKFTETLTVLTFVVIVVQTGRLLTLRSLTSGHGVKSEMEPGPHYRWKILRNSS
jgi:hypothetical protein